MVRAFRHGAEITKHFPNEDQANAWYGAFRSSTTGFDSSFPGYLYVVRHQSALFAKVGISHQPEKRLLSLGNAYNGYDTNTAQIHGPNPGGLTQRWERYIIDGWRLRGFAIPVEALGLDGETETVYLNDLPWNELLDEVRKIVPPNVIVFKFPEKKPKKEPSLVTTASKASQLSFVESIQATLLRR